MSEWNKIGYTEGYMWPKNDEVVLITDGEKVAVGYYSIYSNTDPFHGFYQYGRNTFTPTHWMVLPQLP